MDRNKIFWQLYLLWKLMREKNMGGHCVSEVSLSLFFCHMLLPFSTGFQAPWPGLGHVPQGSSTMKQVFTALLLQHSQGGVSNTGLLQL